MLYPLSYRDGICSIAVSRMASMMIRSFSHFATVRCSWVLSPREPRSLGYHVLTAGISATESVSCEG